jgi:hypothetical protein
MPTIIFSGIRFTPYQVGGYKINAYKCSIRPGEAGYTRKTVEKKSLRGGVGAAAQDRPSNISAGPETAIDNTAAAAYI